ncbi:MAG TPA: tetratricopeptide repeat protein [Trichormus sp.]|jgi:tetratricopeptide (TPR) repeat protein
MLLRRTLTLLLIVGCMVQNQLAVAFDQQQEGFKYIERKNFPEALACFNAALTEHPNSWQILQNIGNCQMHLGQYKEAVSSVQKSIGLGGLHSTQCTIMAASLEGLGQPKQALNWLNLACSVDPAQAANPGMQAAIRRLHDPAITPAGSPNAPDYVSGLVSVNKWRKEDMPLKVYVRSNYQIPSFYREFGTIVKDSLDQWCKATAGVVSYKFVNNRESANLIFDYTDTPELCTSEHEAGLEGGNEMLVREDNTAAKGTVVVLVKNGPQATHFRDIVLITKTCLHEVGHALGIHGHSSNNHDVMFLAATPEPIGVLSERDKNTIMRIYRP